MLFSLRRWIASTMVAESSMVIGLGVIQRATLVIFSSMAQIPRKAFFTCSLARRSSPLPESTTRPVSST